MAILSKLFTLPTSLPSTDNFICKNLNMPGTSWFPVRGLKRFKLCTDFIELGQWTQCVSCPSRHQNILNLVFTSNCIPSAVYLGGTFPGKDRNIVTFSRDIRRTTSKYSNITLCRNYRKVDYIDHWPKWSMLEDWGPTRIDGNGVTEQPTSKPHLMISAWRG